MSGLPRGRHVLLVFATACALVSSTAPPVSAHPIAARAADEQQCRQPPVKTEPSRPWAQQLLNPDRAWALTRGAGVTVAVVDSGVDAAVPQLAGAVLPGNDEYGPSGGPANTDCLGHGTFVAGIIGARPAPGVAFTGIAPESKILPVRDTNSKNGGSATTMARAIRTAVDSGAKIVNVSASTNYDDPALRSAVGYALSRDALIVAAAANGAQQGNPVTYPASYPGVLAVGAIDSTSTVANFSQTGPFVSLVAPGVNVMSLGPGGPGHWQDSGTSFATPFVAGTAALVRSYYPGLSAGQVKDRLEQTATRPGVSVPDPAMGWGTVNPYSAVTSVLPTEDGAAAKPTSVGGASVPPDDSASLLTVLFSAVGVVVLACCVAIAARLGPAGWRRGWRPRRVQRVVDPPEDGR